MELVLHVPIFPIMTVVTLVHTILQLRSIRGRWQAFKGDSTTNKDLLFSVKKSSTPKHETELDVFLVENKQETECDCKVIGNWDTKSCTIYAQDGSTALAEVHDKQNITNVVQGKDTFGITVYPEVDYVFIVALVVILTEIKSYDGIGKSKKRKKKKEKEKKSSDSSDDEDSKKDNEIIDAVRNKSEVINELEVDKSDEEEEEEEDVEEEDEELEEQEKDEDDEEEHVDYNIEDDKSESYDGEPIFDEYDDDDDDDSSSSEDASPKIL